MDTSGNQSTATTEGDSLAGVDIQIREEKEDLESGETAGEEGTYVNALPELLKDAAHPTACVFHWLFKLAGFTCYMFFGLFSSDKTLRYIIVISMAALDFWTVKNITGRFLVGLRWWSRIKEDGQEEWIYEGHPEKTINKVDSRVFWSGQYIFSFIWPLFALFAFLSFGL